MMPNRIIKDSVTTSPTLDALSPEAERLFYRLVTKADDFGRFAADPRHLLAQCFPLKVGVWRPARAGQWYGELEARGLVRSYAVEGRFYGYFVTWEKHQGKPRALASKCPQPPADASNGAQAPADAPVFVSVSGSGSEESSGRRARRLPDDFELSEATIRWARGKGLDDAAVDRELDDFCTHYWANGKPMLDWQMAFQSWVRKSLAWAGRKR